MPALALAVVVTGGTWANAHAAFEGDRVVATDADVALTMRVPHERDEAAYNVKVVVAIPAGWRPVGWVPKATWSGTRTETGGAQVITFAKEDGAPRAEDESFAFTLHSPAAPGSFSFPTQQVYNGGESVDWSGPPGSEEPAPLLKSVAAGGSDQTPDPASPSPRTDRHDAASEGLVIRPDPAPAASRTQAESVAEGANVPLVAGIVSLGILFGGIGAATVIYRRRREAEA